MKRLDEDEEFFLIIVLAAAFLTFCITLLIIWDM